MKKYWYDKLVEVCSVQSYSSNEKRMVLYLAEQLSKMNNVVWYIDNIGNILVIKDDVSAVDVKTYPCVVSHLDTVHKLRDDYCVVKKILKNQDGTNRREILRASTAIKNGTNTGIGGDDKCGIFSCLYFLEKLPKLKVVFFTQEETGRVGSKGIDHAFFDDCRYIIQLDRRNSSDFIAKYSGERTISHKFASTIGKAKKQYGYKNTTGLFTDSLGLWDDRVGISALNLSCGYYEPHTANEYIVISELENAIHFTDVMIQLLGDKRYPSLPTQKKYTNFYNYTTQKKRCVVCGKESYTGMKTIDDLTYCYGCLIWDKDNKMFTIPEDIKKTLNDKKVSGICQSCYTWHSDTKLINGKFYCYDCLDWDTKLKDWVLPTNFIMVQRKCVMCNKLRKDGQQVGDNWICNDCIEESKTKNERNVPCGTEDNPNGMADNCHDCKHWKRSTDKPNGVCNIYEDYDITDEPPDTTTNNDETESMQYVAAYTDCKDCKYEKNGFCIKEGTCEFTEKKDGKYVVCETCGDVFNKNELKKVTWVGMPFGEMMVCEECYNEYGEFLREDDDEQ